MITKRKKQIYFQLKKRKKMVGEGIEALGEIEEVIMMHSPMNGVGSISNLILM